MHRAWIGSSAIVALCTLGLPAVASAKPRPDLVVSRASVAVTKGRVVGSFVVGNRGQVGAGRSKAALTARVNRRNRVIGRFAVHALRPSHGRRVKVSLRVPPSLPAGSVSMRICADTSRLLAERSEANNCRGAGRVSIIRGGANPASSRPPDPVPFAAGSVVALASPQSTYWVSVPSTYDSTNNTPFTLFVWLHGCGGRSEGDIYTVAPADWQHYIAVAVGGREGQCWDPGGDQRTVLDAIAGVKSHFNIDPRRVIIGGYSSGGDLAYRTIFSNARMFAGILAENTAPFRDTGATQAQLIAGAAWRFNAVHLAHTGDETYPIDQVRSETDAMRRAGFNLARIERSGTHYDDSSNTAGTDHDLQTLLLPHIDGDGWLAPAM